MLELKRDNAPRASMILDHCKWHRAISTNKMLHEILLSLAGGPSPLLCPPSNKAIDTNGHLQSLLSPAETALVDSLAQDLGQRHKNIRDNASSVFNSHPSSVCRAVSSAIVATHLARFKRKVLDVEQDILEENPSIVGAYNIVPLSAIVGAFDGWGRRLEWLWDLVQFMQTPLHAGDSRAKRSNQDPCTAADVIAYLRNATHTGYRDIEEISKDLVQVAETAWLKQLSAWVLYGRHPANGASDFFIIAQKAIGNQSGSANVYNIEDSLIPPFVTKAVAQSILFIGKSLNHIRERQSITTTDSSTKAPAPELYLLPSHLAHLSALEYPLDYSSFTAAIGAIRLSLSQNALQKLLPISKVQQILHLLKDFFLLERGEFTIALLTAADERLSSRSKKIRSKQNLANDLASMTIKEGEVSAVLGRTWSALASLQSLDDEDVDEELDQARELIHLSIKTLDDSTSRPAATSFDDVLLPASTVLSLRVPSPVDLFLTPTDVDIYSHMHAYLLAIRRAHLHLSKLYLLSVLRRDHPSPKIPSSKDHHDAYNTVARSRAKVDERTKALRPIWASISSAAFFLAELGEYFQGEVVQGSWSTLHSWLIPDLALDPRSANASLRSSNGSAGCSLSSRPTSSRSGPDVTTKSLYDPETLTQAHRKYLERLKIELLLNNTEFTHLLRRFMTSIDHLSALMQRFDVTQRDLDSQIDNDMESEKGHLANDSRRTLEDLKTSSLKVAGEVQALIGSLRAIDAARADGRQYKSTNAAVDQDEFVPWTGGGIDRLLLKFDYGSTDRLAWAAA